MATCSSILAWKIPWREEPDGLQSMGPQRIRHNWACRLCVVHNESSQASLLLLVHGELMAFTTWWLRFCKNEIILGYGFLTVDRMTAYIQRNWLRAVNYGKRNKQKHDGKFHSYPTSPTGTCRFGLGEMEKNWCLVFRRSIHCSHSFEFLG